MPRVDPYSRSFVLFDPLLEESSFAVVRCAVFLYFFQWLIRGIFAGLLGMCVRVDPEIGVREGGYLATY